jgi:hypothetical protein
MKSGKRVLSILLISLLLIVSISLVSAALKDWFGFGNKDKDLEGELAATHLKNVQLQVAGMPLPPEIVFISDLNYRDTGVLPAERDLTLDATAKKDFEFYVWSNGGVAALPTGAAVTSATALLSLNDTVNSPYRQRRSSDAPAVVCSHNRDAAIPAGAPHATEMGRVYRCSVAMQYYDDWASTPGNWRVQAYIQDTFGQGDGYTPTNTLIQNSIALPIRNTYFNKLDSSKLVPDTGNMDFGTVGYGAGLTKQPTDIGGTYPLRIRNTGNSDITPIRLNATHIPGVTTQTGFPATNAILASWFDMAPVSNPTPCTTGTPLVHATFVNTGIAQINNGPSAQDDLRVCLTEVQATATVQSYATTSPGGFAWVIDTAFIN